MERVLVTGAASWTGGSLIRRLEVRPGTEVLAIDDLSPSVRFQSELIEAGLDQLDVADRILDFRPDVVVHLATMERSRAADRGGIVVEARALFGAIARCDETRRVVIKSDGGIYGAGPRSPSVFDEATTPEPKAGDHQKRLRDMEDFVAGLRQAGVTYTTLRFAPIVGFSIGNPISRYLRLPVVPTYFGFDPRLQFIHEEDALAALLHAVDTGLPGTFNVAAEGQLYLSRVLRLGRRIQQPLPGRAFRAAMGGLSGIDLPVSDDLRRMLRYGRIIDATRMRAELDFEPALTCRQALLAMYRRVTPDALPEEFAASGR